MAILALIVAVIAAVLSGLAIYLFGIALGVMARLIERRFQGVA